MTGMARDLCWNCQSRLGSEFFCPQCVKVQPLSVWSDYFSLFGLSRKLGIDQADLQRRFYDWSRRIHPDFFQRATAEERGISLENSAVVNAAYRVLRDPVPRAEYLICLEEGSAKAIPPKAPVDLLEEMLEIQEVLEEAKASGLGTETRKRLEQERGRLEERRRAEEGRLEEVAGQWDALIDATGRVPQNQAGARVALLERMKEILATRAYLTTVIDDLSEALGEEREANVSRRRH